jgi:hypothetical protein
MAVPAEQHVNTKLNLLTPSSDCHSLKQIVVLNHLQNIPYKCTNSNFLINRINPLNLVKNGINQFIINYSQNTFIYLRPCMGSQMRDSCVTSPSLYILPQRITFYSEFFDKIFYFFSMSLNILSLLLS